MFDLIRWIMADREEEADLSPSLRYKAESFHPVIDQFTASPDQRLHAYKLLAGLLGCFGCLSALFPEEIMTTAQTLIDSYPNDLDNSLIDEQCHLPCLLILKDN